MKIRVVCSVEAVAADHEERPDGREHGAHSPQVPADGDNRQQRQLHAEQHRLRATLEGHVSRVTRLGENGWGRGNGFAAGRPAAGMDVEVRPAVERDADALAAAYRSAYRENRRLGFPAKAEHATTEQVADWIRDCHVLVATVDGEGVVGGLRLEATDGGERGKLSRFGVHEDWKGEGVGSRLLDEAEVVARDRGWTALWLTTPGEHPFLPDLYRGRGYEQTGDYPLE